MKTDHFLKMGSDHNVCEDYIISGQKPFPYVILADGCSTSPDTDVGARLLCYVARQYLYLARSSFGYQAFGHRVISNARKVSRVLDIHDDCLTATLIVAWESEDCITVFVYGDGNIFAMRHDDFVTLVNISFTNNAPYYLCYQTDAVAKARYRAFAIEMDITDYNWIGETVGHSRTHYNRPIVYMFPKNRYSSVMIASDGIESFNGVNHRYITSSLLDFKSTKKRFILRRARKVLRDLGKERITHHDDISIGGFHQ